MPRAFNTLVDPKLEVRRLPLAEEPGAPGAYGGAGSKDGSIPGRMWINLRTTDLHRRYDVPDLVFHETIPGHVWEGEFRSEEHTSELQSLMRISYAVFCLKKKNTKYRR